MGDSPVVEEDRVAEEEDATGALVAGEVLELTTADDDTAAGELPAVVVVVGDAAGGELLPAGLDEADGAELLGGGLDDAGGGGLLEPTRLVVVVVVIIRVDDSGGIMTLEEVLGSAELTLLKLLISSCAV
jgi:hypothetical protein